MASERWRLERLEWRDLELGEIALPRGPMRLLSGFGSGLTRRADAPQGQVWAVGDRGPNIKPEKAAELYGVELPEGLAGSAGAKLMPRPDLGPEIAELEVHGSRVSLTRRVRLAGGDGRAISGLPPPSGPDLLSEPAFDLAGAPLPPDPGGLDTEGIAALPDGGFWVGDEFGPSLVRLDGSGRVLKRLVPMGVRLSACYPVEERLPAIAAKRRLNRGFEALALSSDGRSLFLAFQSPLAHPDEAAHEAAGHVRLWRLDAGSGEVLEQYLYPLDAPETFRRDCAKGRFGRSDIKVSEILWLGPERLLVLERGSKTTKLYTVALDSAFRLPPAHLDAAARPTVEEMSAAGDMPLPVLEKALLFTSDEAPELSADLEGMALLSAAELLLVSDNDFGVEGAETRFWKLAFGAPIAR